MMKRFLYLLIILAIFLVMVQPAIASDPSIRGRINVYELCPQDFCGAAIFSGTFFGKVGGRLTIGYVSFAVMHEPLPPDGETSSIEGGDWNISSRRGVIGGDITEGTITNNGDDTFDVEADLELTEGGSGSIYFSGILDHTRIPLVKITGNLSQNPFP